MKIKIHLEKIVLKNQRLCLLALVYFTIVISSYASIKIKNIITSSTKNIYVELAITQNNNNNEITGIENEKSVEFNNSLIIKYDNDYSKKIKNNDSVRATRYSFQKVEIKPIYPGCENISNDKQLDCFSSKIDKLILHYADEITEANVDKINGNVIAEIVVDEKGVVRAQVIRGLCEEIDKAIENALQKAKIVQPARINNKTIAVTFMKPIRIMGE